MTPLFSEDLKKLPLAELEQAIAAMVEKLVERRVECTISRMDIIPTSGLHDAVKLSLTLEAPSMFGTTPRSRAAYEPERQQVDDDLNFPEPEPESPV